MNDQLMERVKKASLTKTQTRIADYVIRNPQKIGVLSSAEAANEIGVSDASVIRFARAIGFEGYSDLKNFIYHSLVSDGYQSLSLSERMKQSTEEYAGQDISYRFLELMQTNIQNTFEQNKQETFRIVADAIVNARECYVAGFRGCRGPAYAFGRLLNFMRKSVHTIVDTECMSLSQVQDIEPGDVFVMMVYARYYKMDEIYLKLAKEKGAKIILIIDNVAASFCDDADYILLTETKHMSFFNSMVGTNFIVEYLLTLISHLLDFNERSDERDYLTRIQRM